MSGLRTLDFAGLAMIVAVVTFTLVVVMDSGNQGLDMPADALQRAKEANLLLKEDFKLVEGGENSQGRTLNHSFCCCTTRQVDMGTDDVLRVLNKITTRPFFRYYKVNVEKECPYWAVSLLCTDAEGACTLCTCDDNDVPAALRVPEDMSDIRILDSHFEYGVPYSQIDQVNLWKHGDEDSESSNGALYVDLLKNPEANTGYSGPMATRVWQAIYRENCIVRVDANGNALDAAMEQCSEVHILKSLLSGLHTSITMHVAANFYRDHNKTSPQLQAGVLNNPEMSFYPNCDMFINRIHSTPEHTDNLYVLYQFLLRALSKAKHVFLSDLSSYNSGEDGAATAEDALLHEELKELFEAKLLCSHTFDEVRFLESPVAVAILPQMKRMMANITTLMDCLTCEKCRLWGKLEMMGLATALKIITSDAGTLHLSRSERVSLVNLVRQITVSVKHVRYLKYECIDKPEAERKRLMTEQWQRKQQTYLQEPVTISRNADAPPPEEGTGEALQGDL